jgi:hypothetical protein
MATRQGAVCKKGNWFEENILEERTGKHTTTPL